MSRRPARAFVPADAVSLSIAVCGFLAVVAAAAGSSGAAGHLDRRHFVIAAGLVVAASLLDVVDGVVARRFGSSGLGKPLDLMGDAICFGVVPAVVFAAPTADAAAVDRLAAIAAAGIFVAATSFRLARFAIDPDASGPDGFLGLPAPISGVGAIAAGGIHVRPLALAPVILVIAFLMASTYRVPSYHSRPVLAACVGWAVFGALALSGVIPLELGCVVTVGVALLIVPCTAFTGRVRASAAPC
jgi:CDP-diacylglycerol---serine O-phosphatidyltransferase